MPTGSAEDVTGDDGEQEPPQDDVIFRQIEETLLRNSEKRGSVSSTGSTASDGFGVKTSENYTAIPYGLQPRATYEHGKKNTDIMGVCYNGRMRRFVILDAKGITTWKKDAVQAAAMSRAMNYPKYEYRLISSLLYTRKYNVFFTLGKDFSLRVLNGDFEETCCVSADMRSVLFMVFNPVKDELITGGVGGTKVWMYHQVADKSWGEIKAMANYRLKLKYELPHVGGSWVKKVELDLLHQHLYCCSDTDVYGYNLEGTLILHFEQAHKLAITGCVFSPYARTLVTSSMDSEVKAWSMTGGHIHTFRGHSRAVTNLLLHPESSAMLITSSLDGTVRIWSLDTMDCLLSMTVSTDGVRWMGLTDDKLLYVGTVRNLTLWSLNHVTDFWALARNKVAHLRLTHGEGKSTRVTAVGEDSSVRVFSRKSHKNLSTVLPPPPISPLQRIKSVAYNRLVSVAFVLVNTRDLWVYTTRTDPACRIAVWDLMQLQTNFVLASQGQGEDQRAVVPRASSVLYGKQAHHRATENGIGNEGVSACHCVCYLNSPVMMWTEEGFCCPIKHHYLLFGLEDGRILFMDPVVKGKKYMEFRANKDAILDMFDDSEHRSLITRTLIKDGTMFQIWSLPNLDLVYEVYCSRDVTGYARVGDNFLTGHQSGAVLHHRLIPVQDLGPMRKAFYGSSSELGEESGAQMDHLTPVIAVDACPKLGLFCTASGDGSIKIWEEKKTLVTEITLDNSLSAACFLNDRGSLLVGFQNHVFSIDHSLVCPYAVQEEMDEVSEPESDIYEDPAVKYEGVTANPDPVDMRTYLVPYNMEFSKDFLEGTMPAVPAPEPQSQDDDTDSHMSMAPTEVYMSPLDTPHNLSLVDLTLAAEASKYDLQKQLSHMVIEAGGRAGSLKSRLRIAFEDNEEKEEGFELPNFGISPGPTPSPSPPSTPTTPSGFSVSEGGESTPRMSDVEEEAQLEPIDKLEETSAVAVRVPKAPVEVRPKPQAVPPGPVPLQSSISADKVETVKVEQPPEKGRLASIKIDAKSLMQREARKKAGSTGPRDPFRRSPSHSHSRTTLATPGGQSESEDAPTGGSTVPVGVTTVTVGLADGPVRHVREIKKKEFKADRRLPRRAERPIRAHTSTTDEIVNKVTRSKRSFKAVKAKPKKSTSGPGISESLAEDHRVNLEPAIEPDVTFTTDGIAAEISTSGQAAGGSTLDIKPRIVGAAASPGGDSDSRPASVSRLRAPIDFSGVLGPAHTRSPAGEPPDGAVDTSQGSSHARYGIDAALDMGTGSEAFLKATKRALIKKQLGHAETPSLERDRSSDEMFLHGRPKSILKPRASYQHDYEGGKDQVSRVGFKDGAQSSDEVRGQSSHQDGWDRRTIEVDIPAVPEEDSPEPVAADRQGGQGHLQVPGERSRSAEAEEYIDTLKSPAVYTDRARSPGLYSEYGSEMSYFPEDVEFLEEVDERELALLGALPANHVHVRQRPGTSVHPPRARPSTPAEGLLRRPHTACAMSYKERLEREFDKALKMYKGTPGTPTFVESLFHNNGKGFEGNWQERMIERNLLIKMQRQLRAQSAKEKRHLLELRQKQRWRSLAAHRDCNTPGGYRSKSEMGFHPAFVINKAHSVSGGTDWAHSRQPSVCSTRPKTAYASLRDSAATPGMESRTTVDKSELSAEKPFRCRMSKVPPHPTSGSLARTWSDKMVDVDVRLIDPRNPASHLYRPHSSKSIPSKCSRYVLITHPKGRQTQPVPTALEEHLIAERFPNLKHRWLNHERPPSLAAGLSLLPQAATIPIQ